MTIEELHFEVKRLFNKNNNKHRIGLTDLEIDQALNAGINDYVDTFASGVNRKNVDVGFEVNSRMLSMLDTLVLSYPEIPIINFRNGRAQFPKDFRLYVSSLITVKCDNKLIDIEPDIIQHAEYNSQDYHTNNSLKFRNIKAVIRNNSMYQDFPDSSLKLTYIKQPKKVCIGTYGPSPTTERPNPVGNLPKVQTDLPENFHYLIPRFAVNELFRIYNLQSEFQLNQTSF